MNWKLELDALVESTMAFARDVERQRIPALPVAVRTAEQVLADTSKSIPLPAAIMPAASERETTGGSGLRSGDSFETGIFAMQQRFGAQAPHDKVRRP